MCWYCRCLVEPSIHAWKDGEAEAICGHERPSCGTEGAQGAWQEAHAGEGGEGVPEEEGMRIGGEIEDGDRIVQWDAVIDIPWADISWGKPAGHRMRLVSAGKGHDLEMAAAEKQVRDAIPDILKEHGVIP